MNAPKLREWKALALSKADADGALIHLAARRLVQFLRPDGSATDPRELPGETTQVRGFNAFRICN